MKKGDNPKSNEDAWAVEPPKKGGNKKRKALRVALIVAVLAAVGAAGVVFCGNAICDRVIHHPEPMLGGMIAVPEEEVCVKENRLNEALKAQQAIHGGEFEGGK